MDDSCGHSRVAFILIPEEMKWPLSCISIIKRCFLLPTDMLACIPVNKLLWVSAVKQGYLYYSDTLQVKENTRENPRIYTLCLRPIQKEQTLVLKGIFFDVDDYRLRPESYPELRQLVVFLKQNPEVKIEISGHTDNTGSDQHNYRLSENRAFEVYKYLFLNHIQKERM